LYSGSGRNADVPARRRRSCRMRDGWQRTPDPSRRHSRAPTALSRMVTWPAARAQSLEQSWACDTESYVNSVAWQSVATVNGILEPFGAHPRHSSPTSSRDRGLHLGISGRDGRRELVDPSPSDPLARTAGSRVASRLGNPARPDKLPGGGNHRVSVFLDADLRIPEREVLGARPVRRGVRPVRAGPPRPGEAPCRPSRGRRTRPAIAAASRGPHVVEEGVHAAPPTTSSVSTSPRGARK